MNIKLFAVFLYYLMDGCRICSVIPPILFWILVIYVFFLFLLMFLEVSILLILGKTRFFKLIFSLTCVALFIFSSLFTLSCSGQLNSIDPSLILSALYSVVSTLLLSPSNNWFFVVCVVICLFVSLLITSISLLRFSIFYFFQEDFQ